MNPQRYVPGRGQHDYAYGRQEPAYRYDYAGASSSAPLYRPTEERYGQYRQPEEPYRRPEDRDPYRRPEDYDPYRRPEEPYSYRQPEPEERYPYRQPEERYSYSRPPSPPRPAPYPSSSQYDSDRYRQPPGPSSYDRYPREPGPPPPPPRSDYSAGYSQRDYPASSSDRPYYLARPDYRDGPDYRDDMSANRYNTRSSQPPNQPSRPADIGRGPTGQGSSARPGSTASSRQPIASTSLDQRSGQRAAFTTTTTTNAPLRGSPSRRSPAPPFQPFLPSSEYIALSDPKKLATLGDGKITPKLLVLDLNGALIYRTDRAASSRRSYRRPYLGNFLEYVFSPEQTSDSAESISTGTTRIRPLEAFVWSSAQPLNVRGMVELGFGTKWIQGVYEEENADEKRKRELRGEGRLLGVWARDKMGLNTADYGRKVQTFKDLRKVIEHFTDQGAEADEGLIKPSPQYTEKEIILLDDSPLKAIHQPWNQIVITEYDKADHRITKDAVTRWEKGDLDALDALDDTLLAVIGILEEVRFVDNVPAWIRAGGLTLGREQKETSANGTAAEDKALKGPEGTVTLKELPSHADFAHWYAIPEVKKHWVTKGKEALVRKDIALDHGYSGGVAESPAPSLPKEPSPFEDDPFGDNVSTHANTFAGLREMKNFDETPSRPKSRGSNAGAKSPSAVQQREYSTQQAPTPHNHDLTATHSAGYDMDSIERHLAAIRTDPWRTFQIEDVARFLSNLADNSVPPNSQSGPSTDTTQLNHQAHVLDQVKYRTIRDAVIILEDLSIKEKHALSLELSVLASDQFNVETPAAVSNPTVQQNGKRQNASPSLSQSTVGNSKKQKYTTPRMAKAAARRPNGGHNGGQAGGSGALRPAPHAAKQQPAGGKGKKANKKAKQRMANALASTSQAPQ